MFRTNTELYSHIFYASLRVRVAKPSERPPGCCWQRKRATLLWPVKNICGGVLLGTGYITLTLHCITSHYIRDALHFVTLHYAVLPSCHAQLHIVGISRPSNSVNHGWLCNGPASARTWTDNSDNSNL